MILIFRLFFFLEISCSKDSLVYGIYGLMYVLLDKDLYDFNEIVYFYCGEE